LSSCVSKHFTALYSPSRQKGICQIYNNARPRPQQTNSMATQALIEDGFPDGSTLKKGSSLHGHHYSLNFACSDKHLFPTTHERDRTFTPLCPNDFHLVWVAYHVAYLSSASLWLPVGGLQYLAFLALFSLPMSGPSIFKQHANASIQEPHQSH
jgi:hypothetical protein